MVVPWPIIAYDRAVVKNCLWPCQGHVLRDSNHSIYYCMICTGYSLLALSFMLEPFIQFGEYIVMKYRGKPQIRDEFTVKILHSSFCDTKIELRSSWCDLCSSFFLLCFGEKNS